MNDETPDPLALIATIAESEEPPPVGSLLRRIFDNGVKAGVDACVSETQAIMASLDTIWTEGPIAHIPGHFAAHMLIFGFARMCDTVGAKNFMEIGFSNKAPFVLTIQRVDGKTPADLRSEAIAERDEARAEVERLRAEIAAMQDEWRGNAFERELRDC